jgi:regulator of protease activity HflC (stomatin/prohibitin superfamily)
VYPIERFKKVAQAQSEAVKEGSIRLDRIVDWSDHYRVADFQYPIRIPEADTKDKVPVRILVNLVARVFNPYLTAYNTDDDWATRLLAAISGAVIPYVRSHSIDKVLSAESEAGARELEGIIFAIGDRNGNKDTQGHAVDFGVTVRRVQTLDISPTKDTDRTKLGELAFARVDRTSAEERAFGKAADILRAGEALRLYPEAAAIPQIEGNVRAAAAAPNAILNIGGQQQIDPVLVQILNTLRSQPRPIESERQSEDTNEENTNG